MTARNAIRDPRRYTLWLALASNAMLPGCATPPLPPPPAPQATTTAPAAPARQPPSTRTEPRADSRLIPRATLFGNPDRARPLLSPDGKRIGFLAPAQGVMNVYHPYQWLAKQSESDQIVQAMQQKGIPVIYVLYPDEGHGFNRPENRTSFNAVAETFLAQCLGGRYQPIGEDFKGSSISVPIGADEVYGLTDALKK